MTFPKPNESFSFFSLIHSYEFTAVCTVLYCTYNTLEKVMKDFFISLILFLIISSSESSERRRKEGKLPGTNIHSLFEIPLLKVETLLPTQTLIQSFA